MAETNAWVRVQEAKAQQAAVERGEVCPRCLQVLEGMGRLGSGGTCSWCAEEMRRDEERESRSMGWG